MYALDAASGAKLWEFATRSVVGKSSPVVADEMLFVGSEDNKVRAADPPDRTMFRVGTCAAGMDSD